MSAARCGAAAMRRGEDVDDAEQRRPGRRGRSTAARGGVRAGRCQAGLMASGEEPAKTMISSMSPLAVTWTTSIPDRRVSPPAPS